MSFQVEREVKLLLDRDAVDLSAATEAKEIAQVYLLSGEGTVRVRRYPGERYEVTIKFSRAGDASSEYNLAVETDGARLYEEAVERGFPEIRKTRYEIPAVGSGMQGLTWEVDIFQGGFEFLTLAELEYPGPSRPEGLTSRPSWYSAEGRWGVDVSSHLGFRNSRLVQLDERGRSQLKQEWATLLSGV